MDLKIIMGLGNFERKYNETLHNLGFIFVDRLMIKYPILSKFAGESQLLYKLGENLYASKPTQYMNLSGQAVLELCRILKCRPRDLRDALVVAHDDVETDMFKIKPKIGKLHGGLRGHNGLRSISEAFMKLGLTKEESVGFDRILLGCNSAARQKMPLREYVLKPMDSKKLLEWSKVIDQYIGVYF